MVQMLWSYRVITAPPSTSQLLIFLVSKKSVTKCKLRWSKFSKYVNTVREKLIAWVWNHKNKNKERSYSRVSIFECKRRSWFFKWAITRQGDSWILLKEIQEEQLNIWREDYCLKVCKIIIGSAKFQLMVFTPNQETIKSALLCLCDNCKQSHCSCPLFVTYDLVMEQ